MPRLKFKFSFNFVLGFAKARGMHFQRTGRKYEYWKHLDHSTIGEASTLQEAYDDIANF